MQRKNKHYFMQRILAFLWSGLMITAAYAGVPLWTFESLTATTIAVPANGTAIVQYRVTNQSSKLHTLSIQPMQGITQLTTGLNICGNPFVLSAKDSCVLSLQINGSQLNSPVMDGPVACQQGSTNQCYRPGSANILRITQAPPITSVVIRVTGSPLTLTANGPTGILTIENTSTQVAATNITSNFTGTALDGNVAETGNTCTNVAPGGNCTLTYTPGNTLVQQMNFTIQGTNTNALTAAIAIASGSTLTSIAPTSGAASGGTAFTLRGTGLIGATGVTFNGIAATSVNAVDSTTVTGVTPTHATGPVNVVINTPAGGATLVNGYVYVTTALGQPAFGGTIACLDGGLNNLIATIAVSNPSIIWGVFGLVIGPTAQSDTDGASNTIAIVNALGANPYAAQRCNDLITGGYSDWFLPAKNQLNCLYRNKGIIGGAGGSWSSTESSADPADSAWVQNLTNGSQFDIDKNSIIGFRCVRAFIP